VFKIAFILSSFPELSETFIVNQIVGLIKSGHQVHIYSLPHNGITQVHESVTEYNLISKTTYKPAVPNNKLMRAIKAVTLILINLRDLKYLLRALNFLKFGKKAIDLSAFYEIIPFLKVKKFDIIHCHFGPNGNRALFARKIGLLKGKLITTFHGSDTNLNYMNVESDVYDELFNDCALITVNSGYTLNKIVSLGCPEEKIVKLPMGVNTKRFKRKIIRTNPDVVNIITVSRLIELKGIEYAIKAVAKIINEHQYDNIAYHIIGDGKLYNDLDTLIKKLNVEKHIKLLGAKTQEEIIKLYDKADIFVLSGIIDNDGRCEAQGLVIQEAQSMELPVVVSNVGGIAEGMIDGETGYLVPEKNIEILSEKIKYLIDHPETRIKMGQNGRKFVVGNYNTNALNKKLIDIYEKVIKH